MKKHNTRTLTQGLINFVSLIGQARREVGYMKLRMEAHVLLLRFDALWAEVPRTVDWNDDLFTDLFFGKLLAANEMAALLATKAVDREGPPDVHIIEAQFPRYFDELLCELIGYEGEPSQPTEEFRLWRQLRAESN